MRKYEKGELREPYSPGPLYTIDDMFGEFEKWRMCAMIYKRDGEYHCDLYRPTWMSDPYTGQPLTATEYWGWCTGATRFAAVQLAVKRLHKIVNEHYEDGIKDADI